MEFQEKLRTFFSQTTVFKDQGLVAMFKAASIPAFLRDWILKRKAGADGRIHDQEELRSYYERIVPQKSRCFELQEQARKNGETSKFLAKIDVKFDPAKNIHTFEIPDLGFKHTETIIEDYIWSRIQEDLVTQAGGWGLVQIGYLPPDEERKKGKFSLNEYKPFCPYTINIETYREARNHFTIDEWMDVLLGAIDYNPAGYNGWVEKHTMLSRLLPFVEPRINLVELAPKGTGKSYLFGRIGKYGWLVSGGTLSRAKMFYDFSSKKDGLICHGDFVALDEIQSIEFPDASEMQGALKAYMEAGEATFGDKRIIGSAGIVLLGNIPQDNMDVTRDMFKTLPSIFHESALLDRFHGFIQGKNIPRMKESLKINDWALNTEYFSEIMHLLRSQSECLMYRSVVEELVDYPTDADTRDTEAILRVCTAYLKLLFPNATQPDKVNIADFHFYCLRPAVGMRQIIRKQLQLIDPDEFGSKNVAVYTIKDKYNTMR